MKMLVKSITDVITNSSSEVYVMNEKNGEFYKQQCGCHITLTKIDWDFIRSDEGIDNFQMICDICDIESYELTSNDFWFNEDKSSWVGKIDKGDWLTFIDLHKEEIEDKIIDKYIVELSNHFEDYESIRPFALKDSIWNDED